jgi:hypothetical protein
MLPSDRYLKRLRKIRKHASETSSAEIRDEVADAFRDSLSGLPEGVSEDLFQHFFFKRVAPDAEPLQIIDRLELLGDAVDLFHGEYGAGADPFDEEDWHTFRDVVSEYAHDMDMDVVNYVMKLVVEKRML